MTPSPRSRRAALRTVVVLAALWPLLHMGLVVSTGMSSWKLAGWGMYATPPPTVYYAVRILPRGESAETAARDGEGRETAKRRWRPIDLEELREREGGPLPPVLSSRRWLGALVPPERVASALLERAHEAEALRVVIETRRIDPRTGMVVADRVRAQATRR